MDDAALAAQVAKYPWYHRITLKENIVTPGVERWVPYQNVTLRALGALDLKNKRVLDIGCRDGLFAFQAERMGASEVIGIDSNLSRGAIAVLIPYFESRVKMYEMNLFDLSPGLFGKFDCIIFSGTLYHLRYPFYAFKKIVDVMEPHATLLLETAVILASNRYAMLHCPVGNESPYESTCVSFFNMKGLRDTLASFGFRIERVDYLYPAHQLLWLQLREWMRLVRFRRPKLVVNRVTCVCRFEPGAINAKLDQYFNALHFYDGWSNLK